MSGTYILFESASGYGLFEVTEAEEIGSLLSEVQASVTELKRFSKFVKLKAFQPFTSAENALENILKVSENGVHEDLQTFLEGNLPKVKKAKKQKMFLGVMAPNLGLAIQEEVGFPCKSNELVLEMLRGIRFHFEKFVSKLDNGASTQAQLGLGHSYSRSKVKFNVKRQDNMIIQSICLLDQLDKDVNTCAMRVKEWYSWHFPELAKIVSDSFIFARLVKTIGARSTLTSDSLEKLQEITMDEPMAQQILDAAKASMGFEVSEIDMMNLSEFADRVVELAKFRKQLSEYLVEKMSIVAPNLGALIGETVAARLISHAGSLVNLAKCPASTIQILGAEKALFRALKTRGNTPKYGLIFHSSFIGRAKAKNKGRISRYLANKCAIACRIDSFSETPNTMYGERLRDQVEERLNFYDTGETPKKNIDVMREVAKQIAATKKEPEEEETEAKVKKSKDGKKKKQKDGKKKKRKREEEGEEADGTEEKPKKKKKKKKSEDKGDSKKKKGSKKDKTKKKKKKKSAE
mmetsp:Transcript_13930/g.18217  ORF Transcript_13930/g.18217 Transcript_13930/m.18217 type:complete len:520 (-) Transcript_13930:420-1979(-)